MDQGTQVHLTGVSVFHELGEAIRAVRQSPLAPAPSLELRFACGSIEACCLEIRFQNVTNCCLKQYGKMCRSCCKLPQEMGDGFFSIRNLIKRHRKKIQHISLSEVPFKIQTRLHIRHITQHLGCKLLVLLLLLELLLIARLGICRCRERGEEHCSLQVHAQKMLDGFSFAEKSAGHLDTRYLIPHIRSANHPSYRAQHTLLDQQPVKSEPGVVTASLPRPTLCIHSVRLDACP
mmetsp:Transcript_10319/g.26239  ORF Transcript_10319/g.26239 Transcript_10319/m.26239 type:complete len:234 (+) Transcript_10319:2681-3382(+)